MARSRGTATSGPHSTAQACQPRTLPSPITLEPDLSLRSPDSLFDPASIAVFGASSRAASLAGPDLLHVPYKGSAPAVTDLIGGQTHLLIDAGTVLLPQIKGGRLKALAVTGARRDPNLPDAPTVREQRLAGMGAMGFQGLVGPAGLPKDVVDRLSAELRKVLSNPELKAEFSASQTCKHARRRNFRPTSRVRSIAGRP